MDYKLVCSKEKGCRFVKLAKGEKVPREYDSLLWIKETNNYQTITPRDAGPLNKVIEEPFSPDEAKHFNLILLENLYLDDWRPLLDILSQYNAPIKQLWVKHCYLTERGAQTLSWMLDDRNNGGLFQIEELVLLLLEGSTAWIPGLYNNTSIRSLGLLRLGFWHGLLHFIQYGNAHRLEKIECWEMYTEHDKKPEYTVIDKDVLDAAEKKHEPPSHNLSKLKINYLGMNPSNHFCETVGSVLRQCNRLEELHLISIKSEYNFIRDVTNCKNLYLANTDYFDPATIASQVNEGRLKTLSICHNDEGRFPDDAVHALLSNIDLTALDKLEVDVCVQKEKNKAFSSLCHQLGSNRGPRHFCFSLIDVRILQNNNETVVYNEAMEMLVASLKHNGKIRELEITIADCQSGVPDSIFNIFMQLIAQMPNLTVFTWGGDSMVKSMDENKRQVILDQVAKSKTIRHVYFPLHNHQNDLQHMLKEIPYRQLMRHRKNDLSDSLWAHALAHHKKIPCGYKCESKAVLNLSVKYSVISEIPWLFQKAATAANGNDDASENDKGNPNISSPIISPATTKKTGGDVDGQCTDMQPIENC